MGFGKILAPFTSAALAAGGLVLAQPAFAAAPAAFTAVGEAVSFQDGKATHVPNTLYYQNGNIRLEMAAPVSAEGTSAFSVVLAKEGGSHITLLNKDEHQAMRLEASSLEQVTENKSLQKISTFKLGEFGRTFRATAKKVGSEVVAGQVCSVLDHKGKDGQFRMWLADQLEIPLRFTYFEGGKPAFSYTVNQLTLAANLPPSSFQVPKGYEMTDLSEMLKGMDAPAGHH